MAQAVFAGDLQDFSASTIRGARLWVHPLQTSSSGRTVFADRPILVDVALDGQFTVSLEEHNQYRLEAAFPDPGRSGLGHSILGEFRMPVGGGDAGEILGLPKNNGRVRVLDAAPDSSILDQYSYDETTGDLYERTY